MLAAQGKDAAVTAPLRVEELPGGRAALDILHRHGLHWDTREPVVFQKLLLSYKVVLQRLFSGAEVC